MHPAFALVLCLTIGSGHPCQLAGLYSTKAQCAARLAQAIPADRPHLVCSPIIKKAGNDGH